VSKASKISKDAPHSIYIYSNAQISHSSNLLLPTMTLCITCASIPFSSLPSPPAPYTSTRIADEENLTELWYKDSKEVTKDSVLGFKWHESVDALATSAKTCPLCELAQKGVQEWLDKYKEVTEKNKVYAEFQTNKSLIPRDQQLWLTKRFGGAPGFIVLVRGPISPRRVVLLTGVSFAVEAGTYS
jgi:hypothetical protein